MLDRVAGRRCAARIAAICLVALVGVGCQATVDGPYSGNASDVLGDVLLDGGSITQTGSGNWTTPPRGYVNNAVVAPRTPLSNPAPVTMPPVTLPPVTVPPAPWLGTATVPARPAPPTMMQPASFTPTAMPVRPMPPSPVQYDTRWANWSTPGTPIGPVTAPANDIRPVQCAPNSNTAFCYEFPAGQRPGCPPPAAPVVASPQPVVNNCAPSCMPACRTWSGCGLPCENGVSQWHVRGVLGQVFFEGDDAPDSCDYAGIDIGRTFCGCWGLDLFYRWHSGRLERLTPTGVIDDGSEFPDGFHHIGIKLTYESSIGSSKWFVWGGLGPEYFWTDGYINDDSGIGVYGELGIGYIFNRSFRLRAGVNVHGFDTDVTRRDPADDGDSRWLWAIAPVIQLEVDF